MPPFYSQLSVLFVCSCCLTSGLVRATLLLSVSLVCSCCLTSGSVDCGYLAIDGVCGLWACSGRRNTYIIHRIQYWMMASIHDGQILGWQFWASDGWMDTLSFILLECVLEDTEIFSLPDWYLCSTNDSSITATIHDDSMSMNNLSSQIILGRIQVLCRMMCFSCIVCCKTDSKHRGTTRWNCVRLHFSSKKVVTLHSVKLRGHTTNSYNFPQIQSYCLDAQLLLKCLANYVADMSATCRPHVHMSPISCRHCMSIRHREGSDSCFFVKKTANT